MNVYESCPKLTSLYIISIICSVVCVLCSIFSPTSSIFAAGVSVVYLSFLNFSAMAALDDTDCNPWYNDETGNKAAFYTSVVIAVITIAYSCVNTSYNSAKISEATSLKPVGKGTMADVEAQSDVSEGEGKEAESENPPYSYGLFNMTMIVSASYAAMLLSNWQFDGGDPSMRFGFGNTAFIVKILSFVACFLLHVYSSIAPSLFPDRDFGVWGQLE
ncbi:hypothetical protein GEMRC1_002130 [Eukaryota sp. GEM-RC1]